MTYIVRPNQSCSASRGTKRSVIAIPKISLIASNRAENALQLIVRRPTAINTFRGEKVEKWIALRILQFLNQAKTYTDLTEVIEEAVHKLRTNK